MRQLDAARALAATTLGAAALALLAPSADAAPAVSPAGREAPVLAPRTGVTPEGLGVSAAGGILVGLTALTARGGRRRGASPGS